MALSTTIVQQQDVILSLMSERSALEARVRAVEKIVQEQAQVITSGNPEGGRPSAPPVPSGASDRRTPPPSYDDIGTDEVWLQEKNS